MLTNVYTADWYAIRRIPEYEYNSDILQTRGSPPTDDAVVVDEKLASRSQFNDIFRNIESRRDDNSQQSHIIWKPSSALVVKWMLKDNVLNFAEDV